MFRTTKDDSIATKANKQLHAIYMAGQEFSKELQPYLTVVISQAYIKVFQLIEIYASHSGVVWMKSITHLHVQ